MHLALERSVTLTKQSLVDAFHLRDSDAEKILSKGMIGWKQVKPVMQRLYQKELIDHFRQKWQRYLQEEKKTLDFAGLFLDAMQRSHLNYAQVARLLGVCAPEQRKSNGRPSPRRRRYREDREVRNVVLRDGLSSQVPVDALIAAVSRDQNTVQQLTRAFEQRRTQYYRGKGAGLKGQGLHMRLLRERAGLTMQELAKRMLPQKANDAEIHKMDMKLQRLERMERGSVLRFEDVLPLIELDISMKIRRMETRMEGMEWQRPSHQNGQVPCEKRSGRKSAAPQSETSDTSMEKKMHVRAVLESVIKPSAITHALIRGLLELPEDDLRSRAYLGDTVSLPGTLARIDVIAYRMQQEVFFEASTHPGDNNGDEQ